MTRHSAIRECVCGHLEGDHVTGVTRFPHPPRGGTCYCCDCSAFRERERFELCPDCGGSATVECGSVYPGACENDDCDGNCLIACPRCTGEGMVELVE